MRSGRWTAGWRHTEAGVSFRVVEGAKEEGDLRLEWYVQGDGWVAVTMAAAALLVDFFAENEDHLTQYRPHWRVQGGTYFMRYLEDSRVRGWDVANREQVKEPRLAMVTRVAQPTNCREPSPDGKERCSQPAEHAGPHKSVEWAWPQVRAS